MNDNNGSAENLDGLVGARIVDDPDRISHPHLRELYDLWIAHEGNTFPPPAIFDEIEFSDFAQSWVWWDVLDGGEDFQLRFVGTEVDMLVGRQSTGLKLSQLGPVIGQRPKERLAELLKFVMASSEPILGGPRRTNIAGKEFVFTRSISLPTSTTGGTCDRILLAIFIDWE